MTIDEAIAHAQETADTRSDLCDECRDEHRQLADWLTELKQLREETAELKRLLRLAIEDLALCTRSCIGINCDHCHFTSDLEEHGCKWEHAEEAMKILEENDE